MMKTIYAPAYVCLVEEIRQRRKKLNLRQEDLAGRLGVNRNWISKVERRESRLDVLQYVELCKALDINPASTLRALTEAVMQ
jgi:transcriptional regulator with XRE-family HTH domain